MRSNETLETVNPTNDSKSHILCPARIYPLEKMKWATSQVIMAPRKIRIMLNPK